jgi:hypothetical protein
MRQESRCGLLSLASKLCLGSIKGTLELLLAAANGCTGDVLHAREAQAMALDGARGISLVRENARARIRQSNV